VDHARRFELCELAETAHRIAPMVLDNAPIGCAKRAVGTMLAAKSKEK